MKAGKYKKWRPVLGWGLLLGACLTLGVLIYKELTSPLPIHEVTDIVSTAPSTVEPPTPEAKAQHSVSPVHPKHLVIPSLSINTNIYAVGTTKEGAIDAPQTSWGVGWYKDGSLPGSGSGTALIDGHVNDAFNTPGVFYELSKLTSGDQITIIRGDNSQLHYRVIRVTEEPLRDLNMSKVLGPVKPDKEGLVLITCGGKYDQAARTYTNRTIVYSARV